MRANVSIRSIVEAVVNSMRYTGAITSVDASGSNWAISTPNTYDLFAGEKIVVGSVTHTVVGTTARTITVNGGEPVGSTWSANAPYFYFQTPIEVDSFRRIDLDGNKMKYPFIALFAPVDSSFEVNANSVYQEDASLWIVFMTETNASKWSIDTAYVSAIDYCRNMMLRFFSACEESGLVDFTEGYSVEKVEHEKYGLYTTNGHDKYFLNENISGVELKNLEFKIYKQNNC